MAAPDDEPDARGRRRHGQAWGNSLGNQTGQRTIDLTISVLVSTIGFALSWPFWRDYSYFAESHTMWWAYFIVGFVLAVYVFQVFIGSTRTLFQHDAIERAASEDKAGLP